MNLSFGLITETKGPYLSFQVEWEVFKGLVIVYDKMEADVRVLECIEGCGKYYVDNCLWERFEIEKLLLQVLLISRIYSGYTGF